MIPAAFGYRRAGDLADALIRLGQGGVTVLAGGQSLLPALKARTARAETLLDIGHLTELSHITDNGSHLAIGATTRHCDLAASDLLRERLPSLAGAAALIADPQIRHMGTIGGSLAHADPAADLILAGIALDASVVLARRDGVRVIALRDFVLGAGRTAIEPGELITEVRVAPDTGPWSHRKFHRDALEWAVVAVAVSSGRVAISGLAPVPVRAPGVEAALKRGAGAAEAAALADAGTDPPTDRTAGADYRRHLARVLTRRALIEIGVAP
ncbi:FAD binding domain-containing protein [Planotetraspora sp. A-T 1434]|uniref:FAD binding domain-containing protein n=1 Tax=Planotetraspora sp. A-T 1434 TaxID=2979219 RepID=UPI0021C1C72C|nr:FAD binding domain-containing protein [Planotetraspora sp. A-T 1434]MCT9933167.1 FAD binding domain-containing protein [Planotetraspora sp. A-T 1434]